MTKPNDPAFPAPYGQTNGADGLTKREYFAAMAMQGIVAKHGVDLTRRDVAYWALQYADRLISDLSGIAEGDL